MAVVACLQGAYDRVAESFGLKTRCVVFNLNLHLYRISVLVNKTMPFLLFFAYRPDVVSRCLWEFNYQDWTVVSAWRWLSLHLHLQRTLLISCDKSSCFALANELLDKLKLACSTYRQKSSQQNRCICCQILPENRRKDTEACQSLLCLATALVQRLIFPQQQQLGSECGRTSLGALDANMLL